MTTTQSTRDRTAPSRTAARRPAAGIAEHLRGGLRAPFSLVGLMRGITAGAVIVAADIHFVLYYHDGFKDVSKIGVLFLLNAIGGVVLGLLVFAWRSWVSTFLAAGFGLVTLVAFYISTTAGLFGLHEIADGGPQYHAEVAEWVALVFGLIATAMMWRKTTVRADD